ncbi:voltage-dependent T-type calcium channel subunit alpha-1H-like isoform X2 [Clytia hemisphaerica]|uniref:Ion transport domain-containing protein n=1 Tax=Clytia hemisphaerica TaxID=252671 RepID=A0A7M5XK87_9CNID
MNEQASMKNRMQDTQQTTELLSIPTTDFHRRLSQDKPVITPTTQQYHCHENNVVTPTFTSPGCTCRKLLSRQPHIQRHCGCKEQKNTNKTPSYLDTSDYIQYCNNLTPAGKTYPQLCLEPHFNNNSRKNSAQSAIMLTDGTEPKVMELNNNHDNLTEQNGGHERHNGSHSDIQVDEIDLEETFYPEKVFWCLERKSKFRHWAIRMTLSPYFERITIFVILMNCVTLGLYDPYDEDCETQRCQILEGFETFIYAYFVAEMVIKIIASGLLGKQGYLSEGWNRLDCFIVVAGTFELIYGDGEFLSSVRAVRVLRPLRAINRVPSIRILVTLLLDTLPMLGNVFILCVLILMVFAIIGVQLWNGILRNRCALTIPDTMPVSLQNTTESLMKYYIPDDSDEWEIICPTKDTSSNPELQCLGRIQGLESMVYSMPGCNTTYGPKSNFTELVAKNLTHCIDWNMFYSSCKDFGLNPNFDAISFDNSGVAFIAIFQAMTLEGWVDIMYYLQDAYSSWVWIYFVALIVLGSYFLTNLCLVVVATQFSETRQRESALMEEARRKARSTSSTIFTSTDTESNKGCYNQLLSIMKHYIQRGCRNLKAKIFGEKSQQISKRKKKGRHHLLQKNGGGSGRSKQPHSHANGVGGGGNVHYHHHHHHHIHHHHLHLCNSNSAATQPRGGGLTQPNGDVMNIDGDEERYCPPNALTGALDASTSPNSKALTKTVGAPLPSTGSQQPAVLSRTTIRPTPPSIIIDEVPTCDHQSAALIIPETAVVICHSSSLPGALQSQSPLTAVSWFPSFNKLHRSSTAAASENEFDTESWPCRGYRSVGDPACCPDLNKEAYEQGVYEDCDHDSDYTDDDSDDEYDDQTPSKKSPRKTWINQKQKLIVQFCESDCFKVSIMTAIFLNTVTMAMEHYRQPSSMTMALEIFNTIFTTVFLIEFVLKFTGYGFYGYIKNAFNVFDGIVVIISIIELAGSRAGGVSVLRTFRLMRIFKLIRFLPTLQKQIQVMLETLDSVMTFLGLLTIFIFTSSILGMHLFGGKMKVDGVVVRHNFDDLLWSLITVFQVLTQEDWNAVLYDAMRSTTKWASVYFVLLMIIGNYILFNLLVAILVEGFSSETDGILSTPSKSPMLSKSLSPSTPYQQKNEQDMYYILNGNANSGRKRNQTQSLPNITDDSLYFDRQSGDQETDNYDQRQFVKYRHYRRKSSSESALHRQVRFNNRIKVQPIGEVEDGKAFIANQETEQMLHTDEYEQKEEESSCCRISFFERRKDWALYIFSPKNSARNGAINLVGKQWFDNVVLFFILLNCIIMAIERPSIKDGSIERKIIDVSNHVFTVVFTIEMFIKIFAAGFYFGEKTTYLKNSWNRIDFVLVIISLVDIFVTYVVQSKSGVLGVLKVFRAFRTLRPLRVISRAPGLKIVVETLIHSLVPIGNLLIVGLVFFTIFGILGVQLFKGKFHHCTGLSESDLENVVTKEDCQNLGGRWSNKKYNFDNLFQALFTLFVFSTKDGWVSLMYDGIDAVGIERQPKRNANRWAFLYFVAFLLIAGFVVINMVVGVIIDNFQKCRVLVEEEEMENGHTISSSHPASDEDDIPEHLDEYSWVRRKVYNFVSHYKFDLVIAIVIGLNVVFMAIEHNNMSKDLVTFLSILNYIFTAIFILEAIFKIWGFGPRMFFAQRWNQLDIVIVFLSIIGIIFEELNSELPINPTIIRIMRVLRIARVLKILKAADGIQKLLNCVTEAIPQVGNLSMLFMLIFFIYSALGIELFGDLDCTRDTCFGISRHAHFKNFGYALLTLFRVSTGDNWSGLLKDCINQQLCPDGCPMMPYMAPIYYSTFVLASQFVLVNVVVAVLMKQLEDAKDLVSPSNSQASGLNGDLLSPIDEVSEHLDKGDKNNSFDDGDNIEMLQLHKKRKMKADENEPLLNSNSNDEFDYSLNANLVSFDDTKETTVQNNDELDGTSIMKSSSSVDSIVDNNRIKEPSFVPDIRIQNDADQKSGPGNTRNDSDIEDTLNGVLDRVCQQENQDNIQNTDQIDVAGTVLALSGLRDSVISTCV